MCGIFAATWATRNPAPLSQRPPRRIPRRRRQRGRRLRSPKSPAVAPMAIRRDGDLDLLVTTTRARPISTATTYQRLPRLRLRSRREIQPRRHRRRGARFHFRWNPVAHGQNRFELLSQSELTLTFGLGPGTAAQRVRIEWPSGEKQEFQNVRAGLGSAKKEEDCPRCDPAEPVGRASWPAFLP